MKRLINIAIAFASLFIFFNGYALAVPSEAPPPGKIWIEAGAEWILVVAPPGDGPYIWREGRWIIDQTPPPSDAEWIPGHWVPAHHKKNVYIAGHWVPGHWEAMQSPGPGAKWVPGHWKGNEWVPGHWKGAPPHGKQWVPAHRGPAGRWIPGHWK